MKASHLILWTSLFAGIAGAAALQAQRTTATISGIVRDESGAVLPGVTVTTENVETGFSLTSITNDAGYYTVPNLSLGEYRVRAELSGFNTAVRGGIKLTVGREAVVDLVLKVGEITEEVLVTEDAPLVETTKAELYDLVDDHQIRDLPLNGRSFTDLTFLQAGVTTRSRNRATYSSTGGGGSQISIAGARVMLTSFLLDGTNIKDQMGVTPASAAGNMLGVEAVREFSVMATNYSAEFGGAGGVVSAVTKSGTNQLHGSVFWFHRNDNLDAADYFDAKLFDASGDFAGKAKPEFKRNQFGFVAGGPIVRDRTFFFGSYEGLRDRLGNTRTVSVPSLEARQGILSSGKVAVHPAVRPYLDLFPLPNSNIRPGRDIQDFVRTETIPTNENYFMVKVDHRLSDSDSMFVRYTFEDAERVNQRQLPQFEEAAFTRVQYTTIEENKVFSPELFNTVRFAYNRSKGDTPNLDSGLPRSLNFFQPESLYPDRFFGTITVSGGVATMGVDNTDDRFQVMNLFQVTDTVRYHRGPHALSFGADIQRSQVNAKIGSRMHGSWAFGSLRNFLLNRPNEFQGLFPGTGTMRGFRQLQQGYFLQDDWKVSPRLTANLGLRWEFVSIPTEVAGRVANIRDPADPAPTLGDPLFEISKLNLAPRIGFAWDPTGSGRTAVRTGFGIFHQQQDYVNNFTLYFQGPPFFNRFTMPGARFPHPFQSVDEIPSSAAGAVAAKFSDMTTPYVMQYNLTLQRQLGTDSQLTLSYVGTRGVKITRIQPGNPNRSEVCPCLDDPATLDFNEATLPAGTRFFRSGTTRMNPNFQNLDYKQSDTSTSYNALQIRWNKRFSRSYSYQLSYTWGKTLDESSGLQGGTSGSQGVASMDPFDRSRDKGPSSWDVRHNFSANFTYNLPGGNLGGWAGRVLGDWGLSSIVSLSTGHPFTVKESRFGGRARSNSYMIGENPLLRPNLIPKGDNNPVLPDGVQCRNDRCDYVDASQFTLQPAGTFGNLGRNTMVGPGYASVDFNLVKNIRASEDTRVEFRAEFFNLFNRINFSGPDDRIFSGSACGPSGSASRCRPATNFGRITSTAGTARQVQLALKFVF